MGSERKSLMAWLGSASLLALGVFLSPAALAAPKTVSLSFLAYDTASPGTIATAKFGEYVGKEVAGVQNVRTSNGGSRGNITRIGQGKGDLAATTLDLFKAALGGIVPYDKKVTGVSSVALTGGLSYFYLVALKDKGLTSLDQIKARQGSLRILTRQPGTSGELWAQRVLAKAGTSYNAVRGAGGKVVHTSNPEAVNQLRDGLADVWFCIGGNPFGPLTQLAVTHPLSFLPLPEGVRASLEKEFGYVSRAIPAGGYKGQDAAYSTLATVDIWVARQNLSPDLIYGMLKALEKHAEEYRSIHPYTRGLDLKDAGKGLPNLHPGAVRFFKEKGAM